MTGKITRISGPVVGATALEQVRLNDVARVGELGLIGEVIRLSGDIATIQVYEETSGVRIGEPVENTGLPLVATLGPGLLGQVYDGLQRPLETLAEERGHFIQRGESPPPLAGKSWAFTPVVEEGERVEPGDVLGTVPEGEFEHRVSVPPEVRGRIAEIREGEHTVEDVVAIVEREEGENIELSMAQKWPVREPRPVREQLSPDTPLVTGTRVIDTFFPAAKGGSAVIPGGFGTGKTVAQQSLSRWSDVDIVVYVGCGERGNEMTEVLEEFPELEDPRTGEPLMKRTVLIANTSDMSTPVSLSPNITAIWATTCSCWLIRPRAGVRHCAKSPGDWKKCRVRKVTPPIWPHGWPNSTSVPAGLSVWEVKTRPGEARSLWWGRSPPRAGISPSPSRRIPCAWREPSGRWILTWRAAVTSRPFTGRTVIRSTISGTGIRMKGWTSGVS